MNQVRQVLVIGASGLDLKGIPHQVLDSHADNPGLIVRSMGGVSRNIAENLARLGVPTTLLSVIGDDPLGRALVDYTQACGVNMQHIKCDPNGRTGVYMSVLNEHGDQALALSDFEIMQQLDRPYLNSHAALFHQAAYVVTDMCVWDDGLETIFALAEAAQTRVVVDPTATLRAGRLRPYLKRLHLVTPNLQEAAILCNIEVMPTTIEGAVAAADQLVALGVQIAVITLGELGLVYSDGHTHGYLPAASVEVVDTTGAGDALTAGLVGGLVNEYPLKSALQLGIQTATLTLASHETVRSDLSPALLDKGL